ncbi:hypothetical protein [Desmonostoc muscorum]|uniref:hypothetical protein n=1 Tax=Desmonostoc muscorum TaxID=1179 RepID=UPI001F432D83|nr:hypothetical protein [Desmonostoc muscorum]
MSNIYISDLYPTNQSMLPHHRQSLNLEEINLIKSATSRAIDTRKILGGSLNNFELETRGGKRFES